MDSLAEYDPTLPLDFENSANPDLLTEVSLSHLEHADGSVPLVAKINSGRKSPLRARTMKEYETQIAELKKENFSLKLRIYYLDERMQQKFGEDDVFKTNIELKVDLDSVKKDLSEKQELLKKASAAMETMSQTHQEELAQIRQQHQAAIRRLQGPLERQLQTSQQEIFLAKKELEEARSRVQALEGEIRGYERQRQDVDSSKQNDEKALAENKRLIEELRVSTKSKNSRIDELEAEVKSLDTIQLELQENVRRLEAQLEQKQLDLESLVGSLEGEGREVGQSVLDLSTLKAEIADRDDKTRGLQRELTQARANLEAHKQRMNGMEDDLRKKDKTIKELENEARKKTEEVQLQLEIGTRLKKTVQGITVALHDKIKELAEMSGKLEDKEAELKSAREELHRLNMDRLEGVEKQHAECRDHYDTIERLKRELSAYKDDQQELKRSLTQRDGETSSFKELLSEAEKNLRQREDIVQVLQGQVEKERALCTDKLESQTQHYQALLDDGQRQLENKERMLTQLTESLKDKDRQLQECVSVMKPSRSEDNTGAYLKSFQERLTEKEKAIEEALEEKYRCLEERDREVRELKNTLRERDRDLERANQMLLNAEERVDSLEAELKENSKTSKQLANSLRASQKQGEESQETFTQSLEEKEAAIKRLQNSLAAKDKALQEALEMSAGVDDVQLHQQRQRLAEKEKLIGELTEELNQAQQKYDSLIKDKNQCLKDKDNHTKQLSDALNQEISDLSKEVHRLQAELNKKEYELQTSKSSAVWAEEQHKEALESVRNAVREKDKTIQMLSDSLKEREELFREMQGSNCSDRSHLLGRLAEVQGLKEEVALLQNELQDKQDQIERLRRVKSRQSLCESPVSDVHTSTHEIHRHIEKVVEEQMNETRRLNDALQNERQIYINLNTADPQRSSSIEVELAAIRSLRGELEEGLERNKQLRATLEAQASEAKAASLAQSPGDKADSDRLKEQVEELRKELEETKRLNSSLHTCLQENQRRNSDTSSQRDVPIADISVSTYSFAEPSSLHLDEVSLRQLSSPDLRQTVKDLHGQLSDSHRLNLSLKGQLAATETFRDVPGENSNDGNKSDSSLVRLKQQLYECEKELLTKEVENRGFRFKFGLIPEDEIVLEDLPNVDELQADILVMKATLDSVENINTHLKQIHINSQNEKTASQANPDVIMQMAAETEKLKSELDSAKKELEQRVVVSSDTKVLVSSQDKGPSNHYPSSRARSQIPRLRRDISSLPQLPSKSSNRTQLSCSSKIPVYKKPTKPQIPDLDSLDLSNPETMYSLLKQYRSQLLEVQNKLASTEATVRTQGRRCRYYKSLLYQGGLLPTAPFRSQSESCLFNNSVRAEDVLSSASNLASQDQEPLKTSSSENLHSDLEKSIVSSDYSETLKSLTRLVEEKDAVIQNLLEKTAKFPPNISSSCHTATQTHPLVISSHDSDNHSRDQSVNKTDHAMSSRLMPSMNSDKTKPASNENLVEKDREICNLRKQLIDSDNIKHARSKDVVEKDHEICSLRKQLVESQNMCHQLCSQLQELGELVIEYVQREDDGSNATQPGRKYDNIVQSLNNTQVLVRDLSSMLEVSETDTDGGVTSHGPTFDLQNKYDKALKEIQQLQQQLKQDSESQHQKSSNQEQITQKLREEIRGQDCILESQTEEITRLQNYTEQKSREVTRLQSEVKSLQELVRNLQSRSSGTSVRSAAVGESRDPDENTVAFQLYNNNRDTESESMLSDESWDALEREGYRPAGKTSNAKSRTRVRGYQLTDSMESDDAGMEAPQRRRSKPVRNIARKNGTHHINSQEDSVIERQRHQSANGNMNAHLQNGQRGSTEGFAVGEESSSSSLAQTSRGRHRTDPTMQKSQSSGVSGNRADGLWASQNSRDIFIQNGCVSQDSQTSQSVDGVDFPPSLTDHTYPGVPDAVPDIDRYSLSGVDSDAQSSKASKSRSIVHAQSDGHVNGNHASSSQSSQVDILSSKLKTAEVVNQTLKDELRIYHNIRQSIGVGPDPLEQFDSRMSFGTGTQTSVLVDDSDTQLLRENLAEIRAMRIRLEASLTQNDNLRVQLQGKLSAEDTQSTGTSKTLHIHELGKDKLENVQQKVIYIESQLTEKERILKEKTTIITKHERLIREKTRRIEEQTTLLQQRERQLGEKTDLCQKLTQEIELLSADLKSSGKNVQRLSEEKEVLAQQLQEHQDLNNTLKLELSLLERLQPDTPADGENSSRKGFDLRELMMEIRRLRDQLERCIDTNNSLRQKLEERLGQESPRPQQGGVNVIRHVHSTDSSRPDSKDAADGMPSPDAQRRHLAAHRTQRTETYVEEQETRSQGLQNCSPRSQGSYDGGRLNLPYGSSVDLNRSGHSSDGSAGHMMSGVDTLRSQHSQSSEERDVLNGFLHSPRGLSRTWPHVSHNSTHGVSFLSATSLPVGPHSPSSHNRSLPVRHASEGNLTYHVYDPPASLFDGFPAGVDPDIRHLFAVGKVDDYEHLSKENNECRTVLSGVQARITERLSRFKGVSQSQSVEYSTLKELSLSVDNLRMCLCEESRLIASFWVTQLPDCNEKGEFFSPRLIEKNDQLQSELYMLKLKYNLLASAAKDAQTRLHATNRQKEGIEEAVIQQLSRTEKVLRHARGNLEVKAKSAQRH